MIDNFVWRLTAFRGELYRATRPKVSGDFEMHLRSSLRDPIQSATYDLGLIHRMWRVFNEY